MSNMSYCRFQNTLPDLQDCLNNIWDDDLSEEEAKAKERLVEICKKIVDAMGDGDDEDDDE